MVTIPTNSDGEFEIVDGEGDTAMVHGRGTVTGDQVLFEHVSGEFPGQKVQMPVAEFEATWQNLPQAKHLTIRAAA